MYYSLMSPLGGRKGEEIDGLLRDLKGDLGMVVERINDIEERFSGEISQIKKGLEDVKSLIPVNVTEVLTEFRKMLYALEDLKDYQLQLKALVEFQTSQTEQLERVRKTIQEEWERLKSEKEALEALKVQILEWKRELAEKESSLQRYEQEVLKLEERKRELEKLIGELEGRYNELLKIVSEKVERSLRELDRKFKLREVRLERLSMLEEKKREEIATKEAALKELASKAKVLLDEVERLETRKSILVKEISKLEQDKQELERIKHELRSSITR